MIIGICGFAGSGKSEVASYLAKEHKFKRVNFKDALLSEVREKFPDLLRNFETGYRKSIDQLFSEKPPEIRSLLQNYGTEVRRADDEYYWINKWLSTIKETNRSGTDGNSKSTNIVADDVRFFNELSAITEKDGILIRTICDDDTEHGTHISELEHVKFIEDFTIHATRGDVKSIHKQVEDILTTIKSNTD